MDLKSKGRQEGRKRKENENNVTRNGSGGY
jgi:hypothetical protein